MHGIASGGNVRYDVKDEFNHVSTLIRTDLKSIQAVPVAIRAYP